MVLDHKSRLTAGAFQETKKPDIVVYSPTQIIFRPEYFQYGHILDAGINVIVVQLELRMPLLSGKTR